MENQSFMDFVEAAGAVAAAAAVEAAGAPAAAVGGAA